MLRHRSLRKRATSIVAALAVSVVASLVFVPQAHAVEPLAVKIFDHAEPGTADANTVWQTKTVTLDVPDIQIYVSSNPDGTGDTQVYDRLEIAVDGAGGFGVSYNPSCSGIVSRPPMFIDQPLPLGAHTLTVTAINSCGTTTGATDVYLVFKSATPDPTPTPTVSCPTLQIFGVRGSRAGGWDTDDTDIVTAQFAANVASQVQGTKFTPIKYPAIPVGFGGPIEFGGAYITSVNEGYDALDASLTKLLADCPNTHVILAGYSQGAQVAGDVYDARVTAEKERILLVMFGDPLFNPDQLAVDAPQSGKWAFNPKLQGIYQFYTSEMRQIAPGNTPNVHSYCLKGDPVCNYSKTNLAKCADFSKCPHMAYATGGWTITAANWAANRLRQM